MWPVFSINSRAFWLFITRTRSFNDGEKSFFLSLFPVHYYNGNNWFRYCSSGCIFFFLFLFRKIFGNTRQPLPLPGLLCWVFLISMEAHPPVSGLIYTILLCTCLLAGNQSVIALYTLFLFCFLSPIFFLFSFQFNHSPRNFFSFFISLQSWSVKANMFIETTTQSTFITM